MNNDRPKYYSSIYSYDNNFSCGDNYNDKNSKQRKKKERFKMSEFTYDMIYLIDSATRIIMQMSIFIFILKLIKRRIKCEDQTMIK